jgi:hypothetical protein
MLGINFFWTTQHYIYNWLFHTYRIKLGDPGTSLWTVFRCLSSLRTGFLQDSIGHTTWSNFVFRMLCDRLSASLWGFLWNDSKWLTMLLFFLHRVGILVSPWPAKNIIHYFTSMHSLYLSSDFSYFFSIQFSHVSSEYAQYFYN